MEVHSCLFACATKLLQGDHAQSDALRPCTGWGAARQQLEVTRCSSKGQSLQTMHMVAALEAWRQTCSSCAALSALLCSDGQETPEHTAFLMQLCSTAREGQLFLFTLEAHGERYELAATTQQERRRWVAVSCHIG